MRLVVAAFVLVSACPDTPESGDAADALTSLLGPDDGAGEDDDTDVIVPDSETGSGSDEVEVVPPCVASACPDDGDPCTDPACSDDGACRSVPNLRPCDDGDGCTVDDRCAGGTCKGRALDCDDGLDCTDDACVEGQGCTNTPRTGACDDEDACTVGDACQDGACVGTPRVCPVPAGSFGCSIATCDPRAGCGLREGTGPCDDGDACTTGEACRDGACVGALVACDDDDPCSDDYCDPALGCTTRDNRAACDDGDPCTTGDRCDAGACQPGPADGCCADDDGCDDGDPCTTEHCTLGRCERGPTCADANPCTADGCSVGVCAYEPLPPVAPGGLVLADFEEALGGAWAFTSDNPEVGWTRDDSWAASGDWALYVGKVPDYSYDFGATRAVATWRVALPADAARLAAVVRADVAEASCSYDALVVTIDGVALAPPVCGQHEGAVDWDVAAFAGRWVTIALVFDTVDDQDNGGAGLWLDDVAVTPGAVLRCCSPGTPCD